MGAASPTTNKVLHLKMFTFRKKTSVVHTYSKSFSGYAAHLSDGEAQLIARQPGVVSVFRDRVFQLQTTRSWDFLMRQNSAFKKDFTSPTTSSFAVNCSSRADTIIGFIDTGIWPEHPSFNDKYMDPIPSRWKGQCEIGENFTSFKCNRKLIGARYYDDPDELGYITSARDDDGHGTHVASTAAGLPVWGASYYGLANGTARGGSPGSRIAVYRVCAADGCVGSSILKAFDDAIADGVDVISISITGGGFEDFVTDLIAIGAFHAVEKGIIVVASAGNDGPSLGTVLNVAPWILTVAATTIDRNFETDVLLGGNDKVIKGGGINFSGLEKSAVYPLVHGRSARSNQHDVFNASNCIPGSLDGGKVKGKIIVCENSDGDYKMVEKLDVLKTQLGVVGMIVISNDMRQTALKYGASPIATVMEDDGVQILSYINSTSNPVATILPTRVIPNNYKPAPVAAVFSSRGPSYATENLLKPDIAAPGVNILAAWPPFNDSTRAFPGKEPPLFNIITGTSQACPHVSGLAAIVKSLHPKWSPSAIRSAIMTTAITTNNLYSPITTVTGLRATPYDIGAGEITFFGPLWPGLVYETETTDYLRFLCNYGYNTSTIKLIASTVPDNFACPSSSDPVLISDMNYPSIAVSGLKANGSRTVKRTLTNVGDEYSTYHATVETPIGMEVQVVPKLLRFTKTVKKLSFQVNFVLTKTSKGPLSGSITWSNWKYKVRSPIVVSNT
ncbi:co(2)-response secreted protease [Phtheirospermum japonicum]|uniref:Co(2)-response secreted protease n=1 Tax=Phtheirospermum japonicum TaxID=374723 RepID=A0A830BY39_9LAMI|nr:co(2)-response secreted protease [Phtheirospermum japonicum]